MPSLPLPALGRHEQSAGHEWQAQGEGEYQGPEDFRNGIDIYQAINDGAELEQAHDVLFRDEHIIA